MRISSCLDWYHMNHTLHSFVKLLTLEVDLTEMKMHSRQSRNLLHLSVAMIINQCINNTFISKVSFYMIDGITQNDRRWIESIASSSSFSMMRLDFYRPWIVSTCFMFFFTFVFLVSIKFIQVQVYFLTTTNVHLKSSMSIMAILK